MTVLKIPLSPHLYESKPCSRWFLMNWYSGFIPITAEQTGCFLIISPIPDISTPKQPSRKKKTFDRSPLLKQSNLYLQEEIKLIRQNQQGLAMLSNTSAVSLNQIFF